MNLCKYLQQFIRTGFECGTVIITDINRPLMSADSCESFEHSSDILFSLLNQLRFNVSYQLVRDRKFSYFKLIFYNLKQEFLDTPTTKIKTVQNSV